MQPLVESEELESLQRQLIHGSLVDVSPKGGQLYGAATHSSVLAAGGASSSRHASVVVGEPRNSVKRSNSRIFTTSMDGGSTSPSAVAPPVIVASAPVLQPPAERMATYILNLKNAHRGEVEQYLAYTERVKRGQAQLAAENEEGRRTLELSDLAHKLKVSVSEKLTCADTLVERLRDPAVRALAQLSTDSSSSPPMQGGNDGGYVSMFPDVPPHLERFIADARRKRDAATRLKGQQTTSFRGAAAASLFALSLNGGVHEKNQKKQPQTTSGCFEQEASDGSPLAALVHQGSSCDVLAASLLPTEPSNSLDALPLLSSAMLAPQADCSSSSSRRQWFDHVAERAGETASAVLLEPISCQTVVSASELEHHLNEMAVEAGLMERHQHTTTSQAPQPLDNFPRSSAGNPNPSTGSEDQAEMVGSSIVQGGDDVRRQCVPVGVDVPATVHIQQLSAAEQDPVAKGRFVDTAASNVIGLRSRQTSTSSPLPVDVAHPHGSGPSRGTTNNLSMSPTQEVVLLDSSKAAFVQKDEGAPESSVLSGVTNTSTRWASKSCSCESTFHLIKAKMFDDIKRAVRARYVCAFMDQMESMAGEVMDWKCSVAGEVERLADVLTALLQERKAAEKELTDVSAALENLKRSICGPPISDPTEDAFALRQKVEEREEMLDIGTAATQDPPAAANIAVITSPLPSVSPTHGTGDETGEVHSATPVGAPQSPVGEPQPINASPEAPLTPVGSVGKDSPSPFPSFTNVNAETSEPVPPPPSVVPLQRARSIIGSVRVDWDQFLHHHSPLGKRVDVLQDANRHLEASLMALHDHFVPPKPQLVTLPTAAQRGVAQRRRASVSNADASDSDDADQLSRAHSFSTSAGSPRSGGSPLAHSQLVGGTKLRLISTRVADAATQTIEEEDYFLENIESVMIGGAHHEPEMAHLAQSIKFSGGATTASSFSSPFGNDTNAAEGGTGAVRRRGGSMAVADDSVSSTATLRMQHMMASVTLPETISNLLPKEQKLRHTGGGDVESEGSSDHDEPMIKGEGETSPPPPVYQSLAVSLSEILSSVLVFTKDVISMRPKRWVTGSSRSVAVADVNNSIDEFDDVLRVKLRHVSTRLKDALTGCSTTVGGIKDLATKVEAQHAALCRSEVATAKLQQTLATANRTIRERDEAAKVLEAKVAKLTAAAALAAKKSEKGGSSPQASKEAQLARANRNLEETRNVLSAVVDGVKTAVLRCCSAGGNIHLANYISALWATPHQADIAATMDASRASWQAEALALQDALTHICTDAFGCYLHARAYPDPLLLELSHTTAKCAGMVKDVVRMNKFDVPLGVMEAIDGALVTFAAHGAHETEEDFLAQRSRAVARGEPEPIPSYQLLRDIPRADLVSGVDQLLSHVTGMMHTLRSDLPKQRREIIFPFAKAARSILEMGREDLKTSLITLEWYLKKRQEEKSLLEFSEARAQQMMDEAESRVDAVMVACEDGSLNSEEGPTDDAAEGGVAPIVLTESQVEESSPQQSSYQSSAAKIVPPASSSRVIVPDEEQDNPLKALLLQMSMYRQHSDNVLQLLADKRLATISDTGAISAALTEFTLAQHVPVTVRLRRNMKDVLARMMATIEGKNISQVLSRDMCEGTETITLINAPVQTDDVTHQDISTSYVVDDFEPYEGDPTMIDELFDAFESRLTNTLDVEDRVFVGVGEDYCGVEHPVHQTEEALQNIPRHHPTCGGDQVVASRLDSSSSDDDVQPKQRGKNVLDINARHGNQKRQRRSTQRANAYVQTAVDADVMGTLFHRVPVPRLFLCRHTLVQALDVLQESISGTSDAEQCDEVCMLRQQVEEMELLYSYRKGHENRELGLQWISVLEQTLKRLSDELNGKLVQYQSFFSSLQKGSAAAARRPPMGKRSVMSDAAVLATQPSCHASVQVRGNLGGSGRCGGGGGGAFIDNLADEELDRHSFITVVGSFKGAWERLKGIAEKQPTSGFSAAKLGSSSPLSPRLVARGGGGGSGVEMSLEQPAVVDSLLVADDAPDGGGGGEVLRIGRQPSRRLSRSGSIPGGVEALLTMSFASSSRATPRYVENSARPVSVASSEAPQAPPTPAAAKDALLLVPFASAVTSLLSLDKNVALPLRRAVHRWLNEPPFACPPDDETTAHPPHRPTTAALRREVGALQAITRCLERYMELSGSFSQSLIRLVGTRIALRKWEASKDELYAVGISLIESQSKRYKFLKPNSGMNARARREEQARLLFDRSTRWKALMDRKTAAFQKEIGRLDRILLSLVAQREELLLDFLRQYYGMQLVVGSSTAAAGSGVAAITGTPSGRVVRSVAAGASITELAPHVRVAVQEQSAPVQGLIGMIWAGRGGMHHGSPLGPFDDDPRAKSWFDRTGTSQGGGGPRSLRFDDISKQQQRQQDAEDVDVGPVDAKHVQSRQHLVVSADDLEKIFKKDYLNWSQSTAGLRTMLASHGMYSVKKATKAVPGVGNLAAPPGDRRSAAGLVLRPLTELEDPTSGGVTTSTWKGGLVHLDSSSIPPENPATLLISPTSRLPPIPISSPSAVAAPSTLPSSPVPPPDAAEHLLRTTTPPPLRSQVAQANPLRAMIAIRQQHQSSVVESSSTGSNVLQRPGHAEVAQHRKSSQHLVLKMPTTKHMPPTAQTTHVLRGDVEGSFLKGCDVPVVNAQAGGGGGGGGCGAAPSRKAGAGVYLTPIDGAPPQRRAHS